MTGQDSSSSRYELRSPDLEFRALTGAFYSPSWKEIRVGIMGRHLEAGTRAERERVLIGLFLLACSFCLLSPGPSRPFHINYQSRKLSTGLPTGQSYGGIASAEVCSSWLTLTCLKLIKSNQYMNFLITWKQNFPQVISSFSYECFWTLFLLLRCTFIYVALLSSTESRTWY